jgi:uncharacterized protein
VFKNVVGSNEELRELMGEPSELARKKVIHFIDEHCKEFISKSPFLALSTSDENGFCDVSPRGDEKGFVLVLDDRYLVIPERTGNKRVDSLNNIIRNPQVGLLFLVPGLIETLRINGKASIIKDEDVLERLSVRGKRPTVGIAVEVEECFLQCGKALKRSNLWESDFWLPKEQLPSGAKILADHAKLPGIDEKVMKERLEEGYRNRMY